MHWDEKIYSLLVEVRGGSRKVSREGMDEIPKKKPRRVQTQTADTGGSELERARDARIGASEKTTRDVMMGDSILAALNKPGLTGLRLSQLRAAARKLGLKGYEREDSSTETNMKAYERIFKLLVEGRGRSYDAPGHEKRMKGHIKRIRSHPEYKEDKPSKKQGKSGGKKRRGREVSETNGDPHEGEPEHLAAIRRANQISSDIKSGAKPEEAGVREKPVKKKVVTKPRRKR